MMAAATFGTGEELTLVIKEAISGSEGVSTLINDLAKDERGSLGGDPADPADVKFARTVHLSPTNPAVLNRGMSVQEFISEFRDASVLRKFPSEELDSTVEDALRGGDSTVRKLLTDGRFAKK